MPSAKKGWQRVKDFWDSPTVQIIAFTNNDCLMALLKLVYGIQWFKMDDLRFGTADQPQARRHQPAHRPPALQLAGSAESRQPPPRPATDFQNVDPDRVLDACKTMAAHLAEFAAPRVQASKLRYGFGYEMLAVKNPEAIQAFAKRLPDSAFLGYSFGLFCMLACVHLPQFPGTDGYQKVRTQVATEMWYRMLDGLPKLVHTRGWREAHGDDGPRRSRRGGRGIQERSGLRCPHERARREPARAAAACARESHRTLECRTTPTTSRARSRTRRRSSSRLELAVLGVPVSPSSALK